MNTSLHSFKLKRMHCYRMLIPKWLFCHVLTNLTVKNYIYIGLGPPRHCCFLCFLYCLGSREILRHGCPTGLNTSPCFVCFCHLHFPSSYLLIQVLSTTHTSGSNGTLCNWSRTIGTGLQKSTACVPRALPCMRDRKWMRKFPVGPA